MAPDDATHPKKRSGSAAFSDLISASPPQTVSESQLFNSSSTLSHFASFLPVSWLSLSLRRRERKPANVRVFPSIPISSSSPNLSSSIITMALSCIPCHTLLRTQSSDMETAAVPLPVVPLSGSFQKPDRNWSGCLLPLPHEAKHKASYHRRGYSVSAIDENLQASSSSEPRLLRSGGMRRDWSFEDLEKRAVVVRM
ncbi:hypothetical protein ACLOJK_030531 [Asimina triloba]